MLAGKGLKPETRKGNKAPKVFWVIQIYSQSKISMSYFAWRIQFAAINKRTKSLRRTFQSIIPNKPIAPNNFQDYMNPLYCELDLEFPC